MIRGLVIGKFYPPHLGHSCLIETALAHVDDVDVLVCVRPDQTVAGDLRVAWLKELHPTAHVISIPDICDDENSERWAKYTIKVLGYKPDLVFTSEDYGERYARAMGSKHVMVDRNRRQVPIAGSVIREKPPQNLSYLAPVVRAYYVKRICVVGAESTGTTTMSQLLAEHYQTAWVPEYGREYYENKFQQDANSKWESAEFLHIAQTQAQMEDHAARTANRLLICDTDPLATSIWHERYVGSRLLEIETVIAARRYDLYLLTNDDIPFVQDGTRDGEHLRHWMTTRFREELEARHCRWALLSRSVEQRMQTAIAAIEPLLR